VAWVHWQLGDEPVSTLSFHLTIHDDPGSDVGLYLSPINARIDGSQFYLGLQNDLGGSEAGKVGKGLLYSRFGTQDLAMVRAGPTAFAMAEADEGTFVSVRSPYAWSPGEYVFTLERKEAVGETDWFDLTAKRVDTGVATLLGGIRFPRKTPGTRATLTGPNISFVEVYHGLHLDTGMSDYAEVPRWHVSLTMSADGVPARSATSEYPAYPYAEYPNVDVHYTYGRVHFVVGGQTPKCHPAGELF
jgi:hypothetical protein